MQSSNANTEKGRAEPGGQTASGSPPPSTAEGGTDSEPPLILDSGAESTSFSEADSSSGTIPEAPAPQDADANDGADVEATIDLPSQALENGSRQDVNLSGPALDDQPATAHTETLNRAPVFRPTRRAPMALLRVYDDGGLGCQEIRIRKTPFDIGRLDGDLLIPHELQMSRRHLRIERAQPPSVPTTADHHQTEWRLTDLRSLNGTFLRKTQLTIRDQAETLIGGELVRFLLPEENDNLVLAKIGPGRGEEKLTLPPGTAWIGSDPQHCAPFLAGNPFLDPQRLRLDCDRRGRWSISDLGSTNGLWVRVESAPLQSGDEWQCGEQRFLFELP